MEQLRVPVPVPDAAPSSVLAGEGNCERCYAFLVLLVDSVRVKYALRPQLVAFLASSPASCLSHSYRECYIHISFPSRRRAEYKQAIP
ncbi:hypothetical protein L6452_34947 [Arctium lappa]|uniref:Uncharacterized protein n=1 Tax=Arctium lappa TaxID=4217 RepID=A0ACB8YNU4_ARCLA|nr:hypothetical protein L6452_34947 [Arctium lappa]